MIHDFCSLPEFLWLVKAPRHCAGIGQVMSRSPVRAPPVHSLERAKKHCPSPRMDWGQGLCGGRGGTVQDGTTGLVGSLNASWQSEMASEQPHASHSSSNISRRFDHLKKK